MKKEMYIDAGKYYKQERPNKNKKIFTKKEKRPKSIAYTEYYKEKMGKKKEKAVKVRAVVLCGIILFTLPAYIIYRNAVSDELFYKTNKIKSKIEEIEKENAQIELNLQNRISLTKIEQEAKNKYGMQKIDASKIIKIPRTITNMDLVEKGHKKIKKEKDEGFFTKIYKQIMRII